MKIEMRNGVNNPKEIAIVADDFLSITYCRCPSLLSSYFNAWSLSFWPTGVDELNYTYESATNATQETIRAIPTKNLNLSFSLKSK